jgi:CubicO group peptidase (beta-lactamase class C family)
VLSAASGGMPLEADLHDLEGALTQKVRDLAHEYGVPGVAVGVDLAGESIVVCHGVTHVDHPLPVDGQTLFQLASNSKPFVATLVLGLVEEGRLTLDDPVRRHLPEFAMPDPSYDDTVTVRHLLTHRVGWDGDYLFVHQPEPRTLDAIFEPMRRARQLVRPGGPFTYSNAAFSVAGRLVEVLTGQPFAAALRSRLLDRLGLKLTFTTSDEAIFHRVAMRHLSVPGRAAIALPGGGWQPGWELAPFDIPPGGLISCLDDLLAWLRFWLGRPEGEASVPPIGDEQRRGALEEQMPPYNARAGQALGWEIRYEPAARVYGHRGLTAGYCSNTLFVPSLDLAAAVLTNGTSGASLHSELTRWLVGEIGGTPWSDPAPLEPQPELDRYAGVYWHSFGTTRVSPTGDGDLELDTRRHSTEDGSWQPPPEPPARAKMVSRDCAIVTSTGPAMGALVDFEPSPARPAWLRIGGRIAIRR